MWGQASLAERTYSLPARESVVTAHITLTARTSEPMPHAPDRVSRRGAFIAFARIPGTRKTIWLDTALAPAYSYHCYLFWKEAF